MSTDKPIHHKFTDNKITIHCQPDKWKIEISTQEEHAKTYGFLYTTLRSEDKKEPSTAQWIYRHIEEAKLALLVIALKIESRDKNLLYSNLKQLLNKKNLWDAIDEAKLFEEIASARIPFYASVKDRNEALTVSEVAKEVIKTYGDPNLLPVMSLQYNP